MLNPSRKGGARASLFKQSGQPFGAGFYLLLSIVLFASGLIDARSVNQVRRGAGDIIAPALDVLGAPIDWAARTGLWFDHVVNVFEENDRLRQDIKHLRDWRTKANELELENRRLRELLSVVDFSVPTLVSARVIGVVGGPYVRSVLINVGHMDGVRDGLPVVDEKGVVGRAILSGRHATRVLLISDLNSRVPVRVERTGDNAIVVGLNEYLMSLMFLPVGGTVQVGDRLLTSGHGRAFPPDVPVARVVSVEDGQVLVEPLADIERLDFVRVIDFDASLLEPQIEDGLDSSDRPVNSDRPTNSGGGN